MPAKIAIARSRASRLSSCWNWNIGTPRDIGERRAVNALLVDQPLLPGLLIMSFGLGFVFVGVPRGETTRTRHSPRARRGLTMKYLLPAYGPTDPHRHPPP